MAGMAIGYLVRVRVRVRRCRSGGSGQSGDSRQRGEGSRARVVKELADPDDLVVLSDRGGGGAEQVQRAQESLVRLVLPRDRAVTAPTGSAQLVKAAVVTSPRVGVGGYRIIGQRCFR